MTFTSDFNRAMVSNVQAHNSVATTTELFQQLSVDDKLAVLWYAYTEIGKSITPAAPGAARLQLAEGLLNQFRKMTYAEQLQAMRDLASNANTQVSRSYGVFSVNTKLGFWYQLGELMTQGIVVPVPFSYQMTVNAERVLETLKQLDMGQQITVLRNAAVNMGVDPFAV